MTRADNRGIFNVALEAEYDKINNTSPTGTEWANGSIADGVENLTFTTWFETYPDGPNEVGIPKVVHLIAEDIYLDLMFTEWTPGGGGSGTGFGGGFTYIRSTPDSTTSVNSIIKEDAVRLYPNPVSHKLMLGGLTSRSLYRIISATGANVQHGTVEPLSEIDVSKLEPGIYFLKVANAAAQKFVKH